MVNFAGIARRGLWRFCGDYLSGLAGAIFYVIMDTSTKREDKDMFTATVINPAGTYVATFTTLDAAEEWAFCGAYFVRGVSRVEVRDNAGEIVSWY